MTDMFASESSVPGDAQAEGAGAVGDLTGTLAELERKLRELERELTSIGRHREREQTAPSAAPSAATLTPQPPPPPPPPPPQASQTAQTAQAASPPPVAHEAYAVAEERRSTPPPLPRSAKLAPSGRLVDEAVESPQTESRMGPSEAQLESLAELRRFRDRLERFGRDLAVEYDALLGRVMAGLSGSAKAQQPVETPSVSAAQASAIAAEQERESALFEGRVELGVGPFYDIGALGAFEQRLASVPGVGEASVRRFEASHAVVDVRLAAPVALVRELRRALDIDFSVREVASGRILLTFDDA